MRFKSPWLLPVLAFIVIAGLVDYCFTRFIVYRGESFDASKVAHLIEEHGDEIPILGSSKAAEDYVPDLISPKAFNYGMDQTSLDVVNVLLGIELAKKKCAPVIIDIFQSLFVYLGDMSKFAPFAWRTDIREMLDQQRAMDFRFLIPGVRYFSYYDWYMKDYMSQRLGLTRRFVKGFSISDVQTGYERKAFAMAVEKQRRTPFVFRSNERQQKGLFQRLRSAPDRKFVIVFSPLHKSCFENFENYDEFQKFVTDLRAQPNATVLDWSKRPMNDEDFADSRHLTFQGAKKFSRALHSELGGILDTSCSTR